MTDDALKYIQSLGPNVIFVGNTFYREDIETPIIGRAGGLAVPARWSRDKVAEWRRIHFCNGNEWTFGR